MVLNEEYENAVKSFIDELEKPLAELREDTYAICNVECVKEETGNEKKTITRYFLNQEKYPKDKFEFALEIPEVISYVRMAS